MSSNQDRLADAGEAGTRTAEEPGQMPEPRTPPRQSAAGVIFPTLGEEPAHQWEVRDGAPVETTGFGDDASAEPDLPSQDSSADSPAGVDKRLRLARSGEQAFLYDDAPGAGLGGITFDVATRAWAYVERDQFAKLVDDTPESRGGDNDMLFFPDDEEGAPSSASETPRTEVNAETAPVELTRADREKIAARLRESQDKLTAYCDVSVNDCPVSGRKFVEAAESVAQAAAEYIDLEDLYGCEDGHGDNFISNAMKQLHAWCNRILKCHDVPTMHDVFHTDGTDHQSLAMWWCCVTHRKSRTRTFERTRGEWADAIIRSHTSYHNGADTEAVLGGATASKIKANSLSYFTEYARKFRPPSVEEIEKNTSKTCVSGHPFMAAGRHLTLTAMRRMGARLLTEQFDPCVSLATRDKLAHGERPVHTLKDLGHSAKPLPPGKQTDSSTLVSLVDCLGYATDLRKYSGHNMMIWASFYPDLAGSNCQWEEEHPSEATYYADSDSTFVEVVGSGANVVRYPGQVSWDFTSNDIVYVETEERNAFSVYQVYRYPQPHLLKQVVFLAVLQTVNLPYAVVDNLIRFTKGHGLDVTGIGTPGPANNVLLVPPDPAKGWTRDILLMSNGTHSQPTVSVKYQSETAPDSSVVMTTKCFAHLVYANAHGGRPLNINEVYTRLRQYCEQLQPSMLLSPTACTAVCELVRTTQWVGHLPNLVYYGVNGDLLPADGRAVIAGPKITPDTTPPAGAPVINKGAMWAYKNEKFLKPNLVEPDNDWTKITDFLLKNWVLCIARESGEKQGSLVLVDRQRVLEERTRPAQRARDITNGLCPPGEGPGLATANVKSEVTHKVATCPRVITSPDFDCSVLSGALAKTLEVVLKKCSWYSPGLNPDEIGDRVKEVYEATKRFEEATKSGGVRAVDYTAADDSHSKFTNRIVRALIEYFLCDDDRGLALQAYDDCFNVEVKFLTKVLSSFWKNLSGTGITTVLNTGVFCFRELQTTLIAMVLKDLEWKNKMDLSSYDFIDTFPTISSSLFRETVNSIQETWDIATFEHRYQQGRLIDCVYLWLGQFFGDDGLAVSTPWVDDKLWENAMRFVDHKDGFTRKLECSSAKGSEPVEYLSRIYPNPSMTRASFCKIEKALNKLSVASNRDVLRFSFKLRGYYTVDGYAPFVGAYVVALSRLYGFDVTARLTEGELGTLEGMDRELYWKASAGPYPDCDASSLSIMREAAGKPFNMNSAEVAEFDRQMLSQTTWEGIQGMLLPLPLGMTEVGLPHSFRGVTELPVMVQPSQKGVAQVADWVSELYGVGDTLLAGEHGAAYTSPTDREMACLRVLKKAGMVGS